MKIESGIFNPFRGFSHLGWATAVSLPNIAVQDTKKALANSKAIAEFVTL
ncbi:MAG: hypothetical protein PHF31_05045 [Methylobacter sp.]|nr:hypothetical protein [Methylobacter sp.]